MGEEQFNRQECGTCGSYLDLLRGHAPVNLDPAGKMSNLIQAGLCYPWLVKDPVKTTGLPAFDQGQGLALVRRMASGSGLRLGLVLTTETQNSYVVNSPC